MQLKGKPMPISCAKHVVAKAASNAATASANFIVVAIGESLELVGSYRNNILRPHYQYIINNK